MKRCSVSPVLREMQIQTTGRRPLVPLGQQLPKTGKCVLADVEKLEAVCTAAGNVKCSFCGERFGGSSERCRRNCCVVRPFQSWAFAGRNKAGHDWVSALPCSQRPRPQSEVAAAPPSTTEGRVSGRWPVRVTGAAQP